MVLVCLEWFLRGDYLILALINQPYLESLPVTQASQWAMGNGQKNITIKKVFGDKEPKDLSLEECKKAVAGKIKAKTKPKKKTTKK
ncbi:DNA topoisomerase I (EC [uncultured Gammaproteobacteria bacterium]|nr:DNA topoisomerase I (EC [uncultured Gammaproteobacteria bacterium]